MMMNRRGNSLVLITCIGIFLICVYGYYRLNEVSVSLDKRDKELHISKQHEKTLKDQLKVVYHHTTKLEDALKKEREDHKGTREELQSRIREFQVNLTKSKHEAMNRFNALDTNYKMLKASNEETTQNYLALQQNYVRLSEDHKRLATESKQDYDKLKDAKDSESKSLQNRVQDLYNEKVSYQDQLLQYQTNYKQAMVKLKETTSLAKEYQDSIKVYSSQAQKANHQLRKCLIDSRGNASRTYNLDKRDKVHNQDDKLSVLQNEVEKLETVTFQNIPVNTDDKPTVNPHDTEFDGKSDNELLGVVTTNSVMDYDHIGDDAGQEMPVHEDAGLVKRVFEGDNTNKINKNKRSPNEAGLEIASYKEKLEDRKSAGHGGISNDRYKNVVDNENKNVLHQPIMGDENSKVIEKDPLLSDDSKGNIEHVLKPIQKITGTNSDIQESPRKLPEINHNKNPDDGLTEKMKSNVKPMDLIKFQPMEDKENNHKKFRPMNRPNDIHLGQLKPPVGNVDKEKKFKPIKNQMPMPQKRSGLLKNGDHHHLENVLNQVRPPKNPLHKPLSQLDEETDGNREVLARENEERLDVKKVTLEDDENGDQNLDHDIALQGNDDDIEKLTIDEEDPEK